MMDVSAMVRRMPYFGSLLMLVSVVTTAMAGSIAPNDLLVTVQITGTLDQSGFYQHIADASHLCRPNLEVPPGPAPGSTFISLPFAILFNSDARPPESSFKLALPFVTGMPEPIDGTIFEIGMTAGGRYWEADTGTAKGTIHADASGLSGSFQISGLRAAGSTDTIDVVGRWTCPTLP